MTTNRDPYVDNSRLGKKALLYDGHNHKPGSDRAVRWRAWRRAAHVWLRELVEVWRS